MVHGCYGGQEIQHAHRANSPANVILNRSSNGASNVKLAICIRFMVILRMIRQLMRLQFTEHKWRNTNQSHEKGAEKSARAKYSYGLNAWQQTLDAELKTAIIISAYINFHIFFVFILSFGARSAMLAATRNRRSWRKLH